MVMIDRSKTCSFTGHREIPEGLADHLTQRIMDGVNYLYSHGVNMYLSGGALGFDTLAAKAVIQCRAVHSDIQLILVLPCRDQAKFWNRADQDTYMHIKQLANEVVCLSEHYYRGCMHSRNRYLIDNSSVCMCYLTHAGGGTAYTVDYAKYNKLTVFNLAKGKKH